MYNFSLMYLFITQMSAFRRANDCIRRGASKREDASGDDGSTTPTNESTSGSSSRSSSPESLELTEFSLGQPPPPSHTTGDTQRESSPESLELMEFSLGQPPPPPSHTTGDTQRESSPEVVTPPPSTQRRQYHIPNRSRHQQSPHEQSRSRNMEILKRTRERREREREREREAASRQRWPPTRGRQQSPRRLSQMRRQSREEGYEPHHPHSRRSFQPEEELPHKQEQGISSPSSVSTPPQSPDRSLLYPPPRSPERKRYKR